MKQSRSKNSHSKLCQVHFWNLIFHSTFIKDSSHDWINMTKFWLEFDWKNFTMMNLNNWIWPKNIFEIYYFLQQQTLMLSLTEPWPIFWSFSINNVGHCLKVGHVHQFWSYSLVTLIWSCKNFSIYHYLQWIIFNNNIFSFFSIQFMITFYYYFVLFWNVHRILILLTSIFLSKFFMVFIQRFVLKVPAICSKVIF